MALLQYLHDDAAACSLMERVAWPDGPVCPYCNARERVRRLGGSTGLGTWKCYHCRRVFSLRSRSAFHAGHLPLHVSLQAVYLLSASRADIGATSLAKVLGVSMRTACILKQRALELMPGISRQLETAPLTSGEVAALMQPAHWQEPVPLAQSGWACERRFERFTTALAELRKPDSDAAFLLLLNALTGLGQAKSHVVARPVAQAMLCAEVTDQLELDFGSNTLVASGQELNAGSIQIQG